VVRIKSGVTPAEAFKTVWIPATHGTDQNNIGDHPSYLVNGAGDVAYIEFQCPANLGTITGFGVRFVALATGTMRFQVDIDAGGLNQDYNTRSYSGVRTRATTANDIEVLDLEPNFTPAAGESIGIKITYSATALATNAHILGAGITWT